MAASCGECGSVRLSRTRSTLVDRFVEVFTGRQPWTCRRCGWRGRTHWTERDIPHLPSLDEDDGGVGEPSLHALNQWRENTESMTNEMCEERLNEVDARLARKAVREDDGPELFLDH